MTAIQLRLKRATPRELVALLRRLQGEVDVPILVNDRLDVALAGEGAGVHLGPGDVSVELARKLAPPGFIVGASVGGEAEAAASGMADYWGIGPFRGTVTKADAGEALGGPGLRRIAALARVPVIAIGGVRPADVGEVLETGASGIAVVSGILGASDPEAAAREYAAALASGPAPAGAGPPRGGAPRKSG